MQDQGGLPGAGTPLDDDASVGREMRGQDRVKLPEDPLSSDKC